MSAVVVKPVSSRKERKQFLKLPWTLYRDDPIWIPPLRRNQAELIGYKPHPFYDQAEAQTFLAFRNGEVCGRIEAILNHAYNRHYSQRQGFFGFFESIEDQSVASALFDAARQWLSQHEVQTMRGPINPSMNYECGLLIQGFDSSPMFMMTYNPPYYARLLETYGFSKAQDLLAFWGHVEMLKTLDKKLEFIGEHAQKRFNITLRTMDRSRFREETELFLQIYNRAFEGSWGFVPMSESEIRKISKELRHLIIPELLIFAEVDGKPIGACFGFPNYNPRIKQINGRLFPFGFLKLIRNRRAIDQIRVISTNVVPEYQRWGVGLVLLSELRRKVFECKIQEAEFSWVLESNTLSRGSLEKGGAKLTKIYRIYDIGPGTE